jgi:undecaprenyl phosphate-alpha-L-ara4N flippase subunit ArnE
MMTYLLIAITLLLTTSGQILQKVAADKASRAENEKGLIINLLLQPQTWWAVICLGLGMAFWLSVLFFMEVSQAYPYLGLGYVLVLIVSHFWLSEHISRGRWSGVLLIVTGIVVLSL